MVAPMGPCCLMKIDKIVFNFFESTIKSIKYETEVCALYKCEYNYMAIDVSTRASVSASKGCVH